MAVEMKCNLLENIHSCMAVLCGQTLLHRGIITISLENFFAVLWFSTKTTKLFYLERFAIYGTYWNPIEKGY